MSTRRRFGETSSGGTGILQSQTGKGACRRPPLIASTLPRTGMTPAFPGYPSAGESAELWIMTGYGPYGAAYQPRSLTVSQCQSVSHLEGYKNVLEKPNYGLEGSCPS